MELFIDSILIPAVKAIVGIVTAVVLPVASAKGIGYLNRRFKLEIDKSEEAKLERIIADAVHYTEATLIGEQAGKAKRETAMQDIMRRATEASIDVGEDIVRAKLEKILHWERIKKVA